MFAVIWWFGCFACFVGCLGYCVLLTICLLRCVLLGLVVCLILLVVLDFGFGGLVWRVCCLDYCFVIVVGWF